MIKSYQQEKTEEQAVAEPYSFATIGEVYEDGVSLIFPGEAVPSEKHYKVNMLGTYEAGQRVKVIKDSGTYIVEYPVGDPPSAQSALTVSLTGDATGRGTLNSSNAISISTTVTQAAAVNNASYSNYDIQFSTERNSTSSDLRYRVGNGSWITLAKA